MTWREDVCGVGGRARRGVSAREWRTDEEVREEGGGQRGVERGRGEKEKRGERTG